MPRPAGRDPVADVLVRPRYEVFPAEGIEDEVTQHVPRSVKVTVTSSPSRGLDATLNLTERLAQLGYGVVPHLAARLIADEAHLRRVVQRLDGAGVREAFVVAGDSKEPIGEFPDALALLRAITGTSHRLTELGIAGYPESHPLMGDEQAIRALLDKAPLATYIVSQVCFDADAIVGWIARVRQRGVAPPILLGVPGIVERRRLLRIATTIGVGESMGHLRKHWSWAARLITPGAYNPDRLIDGLRPCLVDQDAGVDGLHVYTFNALAKTERWRRAKLGVGAQEP
jgi:methylenetetrahydrofolate reductase (NADH)